MDNKIIVFKDNDLELEVNVSPKEDTVWLTQRQMANLFVVSYNNINLHVNNIFETNEFEESSTSKEFLVVQLEGNRKVTRKTKLFNLDMIIAVGYRVNSKRGTTFRRWSMKKRELFKKLTYDENLNVYVHIEKGIFSYVNTTKQGYKVYRNDNKEEIRISIYQGHLDYVRDIRLSEYGKEIYSKRKETIERVFADAKEHHSMRYTNYRGNKKVSDHVLLIFACMNMKKMANFMDKIDLIPSLFSEIKRKIENIFKNTIKKRHNFYLKIKSF